MPKLLLILLPFLLSIYAGCHPAKATNVTLGTKLNPGDNPWFSPSGYFAFGFYRKGSGFELGIWLTGKQNETIVTWTTNRDIPPPPSDGFIQQRRSASDFYQTKCDSISRDNLTGLASASLLDSGNFVIYNIIMLFGKVLIIQPNLITRSVSVDWKDLGFKCINVR